MSNVEWVCDFCGFRTPMSHTGEFVTHMNTHAIKKPDNTMENSST